LGAVAGYLSLWLVFHLYRLLTGKEGFGYGDFKMLAALGAWLGWQMLPLIILLSSLVGSVVGITLILLSKMGFETKLSFGPYLAMAGLIAMLWGPQIVQAYLSHL
jgi:leader peptidase (prepilin peptidase)/N-methyltransferase